MAYVSTAGKLPAGAVATGEAARLLGWCRSTLFWKMHAGRLHYIRWGNHRYAILRSTIDALIAARAELEPRFQTRAYFEAQLAQARANELEIKRLMRLAELAALVPDVQE